MRSEEDMHQSGYKNVITFDSGTPVGEMRALVESLGLGVSVEIEVVEVRSGPNHRPMRAVNVKVKEMHGYEASSYDTETKLFELTGYDQTPPEEANE
jgi:predicted TIM-barrel enzyme